MIKARCKFTVSDVTDYMGTQKRVRLNTSYDPTVPEDIAFTKYTPCGFIDVTLENPAVFNMMKQGAQFYVDFIPIEKE